MLSVSIWILHLLTDLWRSAHSGSYLKIYSQYAFESENRKHRHTYIETQYFVFATPENCPTPSRKRRGGEGGATRARQRPPGQSESLDQVPPSSFWMFHLSTNIQFQDAALACLKRSPYDPRVLMISSILLYQVVPTHASISCRQHRGRASISLFFYFIFWLLFLYTRLFFPCGYVSSGHDPVVVRFSIALYSDYKPHHLGEDQRTTYETIRNVIRKFGVRISGP